MAIIARVGGLPKTPARPSSAASKPTMQKKTLGLTLPDQPEPPDENLESYSLALYGPTKIGKTSLLSKFNDPFFLMFEPGGKGLTIKRRQIGTWEEFQEYVTLIAGSKLYETIVFDTVDLCYEMCIDFIVSGSGEDNINEGTLGYGKGVDRVDKEFKKQILRITATGRGVVFVSHAAEKEFEQVTGAKYTMILPSMKDRARKFINGFADIIAYYGYFGTERYLIIKGNEQLDAGHRIDGHFRTTKGQHIHSIPMGGSPQEGYDNFVSAFNNEQEDPGILKRKADIGERKVKFAGKR